MDIKFTAAEIIKALECCINNEDCLNCPLQEEYANCNPLIYAFHLINWLQAELNKLKAFKCHFDNLSGAGLEILGLDQQGDIVSFDTFYNQVLSEIGFDCQEE